MVYSPTSLFILNEILRRWENAESFVKNAWWEAKTKNILSTNISIRSIKFDDDYNKSIDDYKKWLIENASKENKIVYNGNTYALIGCGLKRKVYLSEDKTYVIKIPHMHLGYVENKVEYETYSANKNSIYAKCELLLDGNLKMEYVKPANFRKDDGFPDWVYTIAEAQVGYNLEGKLVAYDYGSKI